MPGLSQRFSCQFYCLCYQLLAGYLPDLELALGYLRLAEQERWTAAQARANVQAIMSTPARPSRSGGRKPRAQGELERISISKGDPIAAALTIRAECTPEFVAMLVGALLEGGDAHAG